MRVAAGGGVKGAESVKPVCGKAPRGWQLSNRVRIDPPITKKNTINL